MKKLLKGFSLVLFLGGIAYADGVSVSTFTPTLVVGSGMFGTKTLAIYTTGQVYLMNYPETTTTTWVTGGWQVPASTGALVLPMFHGGLWAMAPQSASTQTVHILGGQ